MRRIIQQIKQFFKSILASVNAGLVLLFLLSAFSDRFSPETSVLFSYLGLMFPVLAIINFCFVLYWLILWEWRFFLMGLCSFLLAHGAVGNYFSLHDNNQTLPKENTIKVLTYNVMGFGYKDHTPSRPNPTLQYINNSDADIVCMQEYAIGKSNKFLTNSKIIKALKSYKYHSIIPIGHVGGIRYNLAVFSKYPISGSRRIKMESSFNGASVHYINVKGKKLMLVNNHLESFKLTTEDKGRYSAFIKNVNAETIDGLTNTVTQKLGTAFKIRARQADIIAGELKKTKCDYVLVCGDFNDTPVSYVHRTIQGDLTDAFAASGFGTGITYNENYFWFRIDNIMHSENIKSFNCTVDHVRYSDHYPLWCYLQLDE